MLPKHSPSHSLSPVDAPLEHVAVVKTMLEALAGHLREDLKQFDEPRAQALFETAAEVLQGLHTAFEHYQHGSEPAPRH